MVPELLPSQENFKRARSKFEKLKSIINQYVNSDPYVIREQNYSGMNYIIGRIEKPLPEDVAWETVEIVQRLRISLDKALVALVDHNGLGTSGVGFPFGGLDRNTGRPNAFPDERMSGRHGIKKKLTAEQWGVIAAHRPYPGGDETLWAINEIANEDKHRKALVTTKATVCNNSFGISESDGTQSFVYGPQNPPVPYDKELETVFLAFQGGTGNFRTQLTFSINVVFGEILPVSGENVLITLSQQIRLVDSILKGMRTLFK